MGAEYRISAESGHRTRPVRYATNERREILVRGPTDRHVKSVNRKYPNHVGGQ